MREILFRGKRVDNGEWVYGFYFEQGNGCDTVLSYIMREIDSVHIDKNTAGQFTGLTDKNGKKIFEGDIVQHDFGADQIGVQQAVVRYDAEYMSFFIEPIYDWMYCDKNDCEVIGNIYDEAALEKKEGKENDG